jgi:fructose-1,6-bisphosphatase/inositol monophosphatase family enzyme
MVVQEILLLEASRIPWFDLDELVLDAEEGTPATNWFGGVGTGSSLVVDPIDGTREYVAGSDKFSICVGFVNMGKILSALVYFPARDQLYFLDERGRARVSGSAYASGLYGAKEISAEIPAEPHRVYKNSRVPAELVAELCRAGFEVCDDTDGGITCPDAILACISGKAVAYVCHSRQMRDILLGAILAGVPGGYGLDWSGETLTWPSTGRVARAVFGVGERRDEIVRLLRGHAQGSTGGGAEFTSTGDEH